MTEFMQAVSKLSSTYNNGIVAVDVSAQKVYVDDGSEFIVFNWLGDTWRKQTFQFKTTEILD